MIDIDAIFNGPSKKKKSSGIQKDVFDLDNIFPKKEKVSERIAIPKGFPSISKEKAPSIVIHNHYHGFNTKRIPGGAPKKYMSALDSGARFPRSMVDGDQDGVPYYMDPNDQDPSVPEPMTKQINNKRVNQVMRDILGEE